MHHLAPFSGPGVTTKPYLMHGGSEAFDRWGRHLDSILKTAFPTTLIPDRQEVSQAELVDELLNVLIAVPSVNFVMDLVSTL